MRPDVVGDHEIHDDNRATEDQVEVAGDELGIMDGGIELVAHVDQPAGTPETEHTKRQGTPPKPSMTKDSAAPSMTGLSQGSAFSHPSTPLPPRKRPAISTDAQIVNTV